MPSGKGIGPLSQRAIDRLGVAGDVTQAELDAETNARVAQDNTLQVNIDSEATSRTSADTVEQAARVSADNTLQANIDAEITNRQTAISSEQATRSASDALLRAATYLAVSNDGYLTNERVLQGTARQVLTSDGGADGNFTLSLPQNIDTAAEPTFSGMYLDSGLNIRSQDPSLGMTELRFYERPSSGVNYAGFRGSQGLGTNIVWELPAADGSANQVLSTNGAGILSWATAGGSQSNEATNSTQTTDATPATLRTIALSNNTGYWAYAIVRAEEAAGGGTRGFWILTTDAYRASGGAASVAGDNLFLAQRENDADIGASWNPSSNDLLLQVSGVAGKTLNWTETSWYAQSN